MATKEEKIMGGNYAEDNFTENDVLACLDAAGLKHKNGGRYILSQCPLHEDGNASAQIYKDDWFVKCHVGCEGGRFHITKAFPELRGTERPTSASRPRATPKKDTQSSMNYVDKSGEIMAVFNSLPEIPRDHNLHGVPAETLNDLGWRFDSVHNRYFIPYWSRTKQSIPFAQWRNLNPGTNRFNFWKDAKPTMYGTFNLYSGDPVFLVEGASDAAVMDYCAVPWIAAPSAASGELVKALAAWAQQNNIAIIYAGDNDDAGDKLKDALDSVTSYRVKQPRKPYKDWGEMFEAEGWESVQNYCFEELFPKQLPEMTAVVDPEWAAKTDVERVQTVFPGAVQLTLVGEGKEATQNPPQALF